MYPLGPFALRFKVAKFFTHPDVSQDSNLCSAVPGASNWSPLRVLCENVLLVSCDTRAGAREFLLLNIARPPVTIPVTEHPNHNYEITSDTGPLASFFNLLSTAIFSHLKKGIHPAPSRSLEQQYKPVILNLVFFTIYALLDLADGAAVPRF